MPYKSSMSRNCAINKESHFEKLRTSLSMIPISSVSFLFMNRTLGLFVALLLFGCSDSEPVQEMDSNPGTEQDWAEYALSYKNNLHTFSENVCDCGGENIESVLSLIHI